MISEILDTVDELLASTEGKFVSQLEQFIVSRDRVFLVAAGRSRLVAQMFAMRLMHLGIGCFVVGDVLTPAIKSGDLLIAISGSGKTEGVISAVAKANKIGATTVGIVGEPLTNKESTPFLHNVAGMVINLFDEGDLEENVNFDIMPMGSGFELSCLFFLEEVVAFLMDGLSKTPGTMRAIHANLE